MWSVELLGMNMYHLAGAFVLYCMFGWLVESIYMSFCEKKITNRGFAKGPFCPIYGFGAVLGAWLLTPFSSSYLLTYIVGMISATTFEYIVGRLMIRFLGSLWWDYDDKPYNYQGIICLESTIAWGFYAIGVVFFVNGWIHGIIESIPMKYGTVAIITILSIAAVDYIIQLTKIFGHRAVAE